VRRTGNVPQPLDKVSLKSIWADLKKPSLGLILFLIGFHGMYIVPLLFPHRLFEPSPDSAFRFYYASWLLISAGGVLETFAGGLWWIRRKRLWAAVLATAMSIMTTISLLSEESVLSISYKSFPFYWMLLLPAVGLKPRNWPWLWLSFLIQAPVGIFYSLDAFVVRGVTTRLATFEMVGQNFLGQCLYMATFLFLMLPIFRDKRLRVLALGLFGLENLRCFFISNRYTWFLLPVEVLMVMYVTSRSRGTFPTLQRFFVKALFAVLLVVSLSLAIGQSQLIGTLTPTFGEAYEGLIQRMGGGSVHDAIADDNRWLELTIVSGTMDKMDWVFGKGLGARWSDPFYANWDERFMVHNTWVNSFYWGGICLALGVTWPILWAIRVILYSHSTAGICSAMYLLLLFMKFPAYLVTLPSLEWLLFCLALGVCVYDDRDPSWPNARVALR
jgi:hypothetical protein